MSAITLTRKDAARNLYRFYRLDVQPDLFRDWCLVKECGRIGCPGKVRFTPFPTAAEAQAAMERSAASRRGGDTHRRRGRSQLGAGV